MSQLTILELLEECQDKIPYLNALMSHLQYLDSNDCKISIDDIKERFGELLAEVSIFIENVFLDTKTLVIRFGSDNGKILVLEWTKTFSENIKIFYRKLKNES